MDTRLLEDLAALAETGSLTRAAAARHVTHPAFGRRIRQLEAWAGTALLERGHTPLTLTAAGRELLAQAEPLLQALAQTRSRLRGQGTAGAAVPRLRVGTGRTLARTLVADWLARLRAPLKGVRVEVVTRSMADIALLFERGEVDLLCCYEHPALSIRLSAQRFRHLSLAQDRLVPVSQADAHGAPRHRLDGGRLIGYAPTLTLGQLTRDHLERSGRNGEAAIVCDSADAIQEFVARGLGLAWLPWSLVSADCRRGTLVALGGRAEQIPFEVRLYRPRARQDEALEAAWAATAR
ncbi:MAG: LysR family transcriptional regulator [Burkholderiaceae bacterium]|nr:LysR family transcriptional regulator [Burkholderiaceae bacterium]